jgi:Ribosomal protein L7/L12 C-terminal domain
MFAVLEFWDFFWIWCIVSLAVSLYAGGAAAYARFKPKDAARLRRLEAKADLILRHLGLEYQDPATPGRLSEEVKALADDPARKIEAIKLHSEQTGLGLKEAKDAVEGYIAGGD